MRLSKYGICTHIYEIKRPYKDSFNIIYSLRCTNEAHCIDLIHRLYYEDDVLCLKRKYDKIKHLLGSAT